MYIYFSSSNVFENGCIYIYIYIFFLFKRKKFQKKTMNNREAWMEIKSLNRN